MTRARPPLATPRTDHPPFRSLSRSRARLVDAASARRWRFCCSSSCPPACCSARRRRLGQQHPGQLGLRDPQLRLVARHRPCRHADLGAAAPGDAHWRNSLNRFAETMTLFAVDLRRALSDPASRAALALLLDGSLSEHDERLAAVQEPAGLGLLRGADLSHRLGGVLVSSALIPDLAAVRDRARTRRRAGVLRAGALGWRGSARHWARWQQAYRLMAALAVPLVVRCTAISALLFAAGPIPGWDSTVFPPYFVLGAAFSGFAVVSMIADRAAPRASACATSSPSAISTCSASCCSRPA